ncbi:MAG: fumarylacetoacetate hydrolase family protein, partial [Bacteroidaceae bacterium]|nr:fumarylacetoacetate hydrolase family protein [Bacteroidaceae bacterium]
MKIIAVGKNYSDHALEFDGTVERPAVPMIFMKPDSSILKNGKPFFLPDFLGCVEYEAEIVVRISNLGKNIPTRFAHRYYDAVTVGIDFTAREW